MKDNNEHKARRGEKLQIPAGTWNNVLDATKDYKRNKYNPENAVNAGVPTSLTQSNLEILIRNESDYDLPTSYKILRLTDIVCDTDHIQQSNRYVFEGETPTFATNKFAVVQQPLVIGDMGKAIISGLAFTRVHMVNLAHEYANPTPNVDGWLTSDTTGQARILYFTATGDAGEAAADIYFAVVNIGDGKGANGDTVNRIMTLIESDIIEGEQGPPGRRGPQGERGIQGKHGYPVPGEDGLDGETIFIPRNRSAISIAGFVNLVSDYTFSGSAEQSVGLSITLPSAGYYMIGASIAWSATSVTGGSMYGFIRRADNYYFGTPGVPSAGLANNVAAFWNVVQNHTNASSGGSWSPGPSFLYRWDGTSPGTLDTFTLRASLTGTWAGAKVLINGGSTIPTELRYAKIG